MIKTTKKLICDICKEKVEVDDQAWSDKKIKDEAIKQDWLISFPNGGSELLDICPECRCQIANRAVEHRNEAVAGRVPPSEENTTTDEN